MKCEKCGDVGYVDYTCILCGGNGCRFCDGTGEIVKTCPKCSDDSPAERGNGRRRLFEVREEDFDEIIAREYHRNFIEVG